MRLWRFAPGAKEPGERIETAVHPREMRLSPDGRWLAYTSPASGHSEVYVQGFPEGARHQITVGGGRSAQWRHDGRELYYLTDDATTLNAAPVRTTPRLEIGVAKALFKISPGSQYAPAPDGRTFYVALHQAAARPSS